MEGDGVHLATSEHYLCGWEGCQQQLATQQQLVEHVTSQHVQLASSTYRCLWRGCSRRQQGFNARYKMFVHIRTHTKERPHVCTDCGKGFSRQENLKIHKRSHTGEKPYACTFEGCDRAYSNSSDRFKHTRTHFVDRPYSCRYPGCSKSYTDPSSLRKHMRANGHSRPTSPAATPPPGGKAEKLRRVSRRPMALESEAGDSAVAPVATPVSVVTPSAPVPAECGGCACGRPTAPFGWDSWLWYPWVQQMGQLWGAGCSEAVFRGHSEVHPGSVCGMGGVGSAPLVSQPTASPAPLDLRVPPN